MADYTLLALIPKVHKELGAFIPLIVANCMILGRQEAFAPARALYLRFGFELCGPFADYGPDPNSVFMTRAL